ncbi:hypothetical protein ACS0TY_009679 [Phlomoides rotata]
MLNVYWWGSGTDVRKGIKWTTWDKLCEPKAKGGMGFRNLHVFNTAMLGKWCWKLLSQPDALVSRALKAKYFPRVGILDAAVGNNPSMIWRGIHSAIGLVRMGCRWKIGDGTTIRVWGMPWLNRDSDFFVRTPMLPGWEAVLVSDLFVPGTRVWNMELINWIFTEEDRDVILKTTPGMGDAGDRLIWHYTRNGVYSVKSAYSLGMQLVGEGNEAGHAAWKIIWKIKCNPRAKHCLWRFARGFVHVNTRL